MRNYTPLAWCVGFGPNAFAQKGSIEVAEGARADADRAAPTAPLGESGSARSTRNWASCRCEVGASCWMRAGSRVSDPQTTKAPERVTPRPSETSGSC